MFIGTATPKIDDKFRLALPTKFREELAKDVSVVCEMDGCLGIYRRPDFEEIMAQATVAPTTFRDV
ncbi:MAG: cell division/cell wall cluster transcriptional repressor MraZ, partial [Propionibacteriaceae bacterium]|nr:cell division/cell wall cluster transcriptional repressor MraZ [Propionibacteriaceae bacterium]